MTQEIAPPSVHHHTTLSAYISSQLRHVSTIGKKLLNSNISPTSPHNVANVGPPTAEIGIIGWRVWGTPANFNAFHVLASLYCSDVAHRRPTKLCTRSLAVCWAGTLYVHFRGLLPPDGILPRAKNSRCVTVPRLAFSYNGSVTARHWNSRRQPKFAGVLQRIELRNFRRGRQLYSAGWPSRLASAHILVSIILQQPYTDARLTAAQLTESEIPLR